MPKLLVLTASTRPGRVGAPVTRWFVDLAAEHGVFTLDPVDLAELNLPFMDEPAHPRLSRYTHRHTKEWSARVAAADAFVFVMPEYNYGFNAPLKNAIDYLYHEWQKKPVGFVSYGGMSGGLRAVQMVKQVVTALNMVPLNTAVAIPFVARFIDEQGAFRPEESVSGTARTMLDELLRWTEALTGLRSRME